MSLSERNKIHVVKGREQGFYSVLSSQLTDIAFAHSSCTATPPG
jgi:hypothetical protein